MPEIGGNKLATDFASMMADVRKAIDEAKNTVAGAARELKAEITDGAKAAAKAIRQEATTVRDGYAALLGNSPPETAAGESKQPEALPKAGQVAAPAAMPGPSGGTAKATPFPDERP